MDCILNSLADCFLIAFGCVKTNKYEQVTLQFLGNWLLSVSILLNISVKPYHWHYTVEQTSTMNREEGSWKPIIILFSTPRGRAAPESCRETFQYYTSWGSQLWQEFVPIATEGLTLPGTQDVQRDIHYMISFKKFSYFRESELVLF